MKEPRRHGNAIVWLGCQGEAARVLCGGHPVESLLALDEHLADAKTPTVKELLQQQIDATDRQIDRLGVLVRADGGGDWDCGGGGAIK